MNQKEKMPNENFVRQHHKIIVTEMRQKELEIYAKDATEAEKIAKNIGEGLWFMDNKYTASREYQYAGLSTIEDLYQNQVEGDVQTPFETIDLSIGPFSMYRDYTGAYTFSLTNAEYKQNLFFRYASLCGEPAMQGGRYCYGTGHDWEGIFRYLFHEHPDYSCLWFDSESEGFYASAYDFEKLLYFAQSFYEATTQDQTFFDAIIKGLAWAEQEKQMQMAEEIEDDWEWCM